MTTHLRRLPITLLLLLVLGASVSAAAQDQVQAQDQDQETEETSSFDTGSDASGEAASSAGASGNGGLGAVLQENQGALVTVKFVLQVKIGGAAAAGLGDQELENEVTCTTIDPKGLILCSSTVFNAYVDLMAQMIPSGIELSPVPKDMKVLTGKDGEELSARMVIRDSDRDLVWLQIEDVPEDRTFPYVDFEDSAEPAIGDELVCLWRMDRFYERSAALSTSRVGGIVERPRRLLVPSAAFSGGLGAPVFDVSGKAVGLTISQVADDGSLAQSDNPFAAMSQSLRLQQGVQGLVLPASEIVKATRQVLALESEAEE